MKQLEMGLGKTLMFISLIADCKINRKEVGPTLIVCPLSIIQIWQKQLVSSSFICKSEIRPFVLGL